MKREGLPPPPRQRAEFDPGVVDSDPDPDAIFMGRVSMLLRLEYDQALELLRCLVAELQRDLARSTSDEILQIWLEPGLLTLYPFDAAEGDPSKPSRT